MTAKWKKKLLLVEYNLLSLEEARQQVKRFRSISELVDYIVLDGSTYIVKLVPDDYRPKLKNYIVIDKKSLENFKNGIKTIRDYSELWCCKNECFRCLPVYGRFAMYCTGQTIELIRGETARLLEKVPNDNPYVCGTRFTWGWHYDIIGSKDLPFQIVATHIEEKRYIIELLFDTIQRIGAKSLSLEFLVDNDRLIFTDWDSDDDRKILNEWRFC